ncbi:GNAT family N-acetyltransferase [Amycolatopsis thermophila]|uniref:Ribosomal protein S18 acetylase RimI-like enzyme n=1 Tax=Amycolatopsis thermophila TaxID=206084 RepID=A0ABU0EVN3_9PSEU|nr:GNAT family N-acetyltransferase [Amycolatopsis thermophila]MDQ0379369.1 ribosomal protein S18 acetylase RimI-like enzyme [Amycolatopsis thermophila]
MEIRPAAAGDVPEIAEVHVRSWQEGYRGLLPPDVLDVLDPAQRIERWSRIVAGNALPREGTLVAVRAGALLGFVNLGPSRDEGGDGDRTGEIRSLYVRPTAWRGGVGRRLLAEALRSLTAAGFRTVSLSVLDGNVRAMRFYSACGFTPDGTVEDARHAGLDVRTVRYRRDLP